MAELDLPRTPGTYVLVLLLPAREMVDVGALGRREFPGGIYLYTGSAFGPGGVRARIGRHLRSRKKLHWHIDYLLPQDRTREVWVLPSDHTVEHRVARRLREHPLTTVPVRGFGSSDCSCAAHLVYLPRLDSRSRLFQSLKPGGKTNWVRCRL